MTSSLLCHNISDKLIAVGYPYSFNDKANSTSEIDFRNLRDIVVFLEDTVLRTLPIQSRATLKQNSTGKTEFYRALHDYCDSNNNTNIVKVASGGAFVQLQDGSTGITKLLKDLRPLAENESLATTTTVNDLAAVVLVDRLLDVAIAQIVHDKSMSLEAAHAKWTDEQGKRNVASLDLSSSLMANKKKDGDGDDDENGDKGGNKDQKSSSLSKAISEILACRTTSSSNNFSSTTTNAQIGAAARFAIGLVDYDHHQNISAKVGANSTSNSSSRRRTSYSYKPLKLDEEWTKIALSEVTLFGEPRVIYDSHTAAKKKLDVLQKSAGDANNKNNNNNQQLLQDCARALRAIFTQDYTALQRRINVALARMQDLTATCATDPKLGRTGK